MSVRTATIVFLHAHPDDECLVSGGTIAKYAAEGHRVVLVTATDGRHGERPADIDSPEALLARRRKELAAAVGILRIARHEWLGYEDSGMTGWPQNQHAAAFIRSDVDEAAHRFAAIVREEQRNASRVVIVGYDWHGNYGHPDHVHVHKVARRAAALCGIDELFEVTLNRDFFAAQFEWSKANGGDNDFDPREPADDGNPMGEPESAITHHIDVSAHVGTKRRAIAAHASQVSDTGFAVELSDDSFLRAFGTEWFVKVGAPSPSRHASLLE
jgi:LmbE family N-acetylglucosaminyl deacetylase